MQNSEDSSSMDTIQPVPRDYVNSSDRRSSVRLSFHSRHNDEAARRSQGGLDDSNDFQWQIPPEMSSDHAKDSVPVGHNGRFISDGDRSSKHYKIVMKDLVWPLLVITVPVALCSAILLFLVYNYRVNPNEGSTISTGTHTSISNKFILVNYSATRLVFAATALSTLAPLLVTFIMILQSLPTARAILRASQETKLSDLPTPYQLSLLVGILLGSTEQLRQYGRYFVTRDRQEIPPALHRAARMLIIGFFMATAVVAAATGLQYSTQTVDFDLVTPSASISYAFGRGLSELCLTTDRIENYGFPCPIGNGPDVVLQEALIEQFHLQHNDSVVSEIRYTSVDGFNDGALSILLPQTSVLPAGIEYRASTIGVSTQCRPITSICNMSTINDGSSYTKFNCSANFWGLLGKAPNISEIGGNGEKALDVNLPGLDWKPSADLQYGFFNDSNLQNPYNSVGWDPTDGWSDPTLAPLPDQDLINPIYLGVAGRFPTVSEAIGDPLTNDSEFHLADPFSILDFALVCPFTTYDVNYTWVNGTISGVSASASPNGSVAEIFHGALQYVTVSGTEYDLQDDILQAALEPDSSAFARKWSDSYSLKVLSSVGAYTTSRTNLDEQYSTRILVAKVHVGALAALIACSLSYIVLARILGISACRAFSPDAEDLAARLSLAGFAEAAFDPAKKTVTAGADANKSQLFDEKLKRSESRRVGVDSKPGAEIFRVWF